MRKDRLTIFLNFIILFGLTTSCNPEQKVEKQETTTEEKMAKPTLAHTVYFWLKEGTTEEEKLAFEKGLTKLGTVPSIHTFYWGAPASTEARDVVDHSYAYAINSLFESLNDQLTYQKHPIHLEFVENHQHIWESVKVYDNVTN